MKMGKGDTRRVVYSAITGIVLGLFLVSGFCTQSLGRLRLWDARFWLAVTGISAVLFVLSYLFMGFKGFGGKGAVSDKTRRIIVLSGFVFIFLAWLIQLIGIYPGFFNYDADEQWTMYANSVVTAHHPVLHTYLVGKCLHLSYLVFKTPLQGCFIYLVFQMLVSAFAYAASIRFMLKRGLHVLFSVAAVLWFSFAPTVVICVMSVTKDSLFTPFLILFVLETVTLLTLKDGEKFRWYSVVIWCVSAFLTAVLRNNAMYIMIPFMIVFMIVFRKKKQVFFLAGVLAALFVYFVPVTKAITVEGVNEREYLSVPVQQLMRVYHLHGEKLSSDELALIDEAFEIDAKVVYIPKIADVAKGSLKREYFDEHKKEMIKLWADLGKRYPIEYIEAFFLDNSGFWYPWTTLALTANGAEGYYVCRSYLPVWNDPKIPAVMEYYKHYENSGFVCNNPLTMWIFAPATYFYIFWITFMYLMYKRKAEAVPMAAVFLIWLTFLLGPVALVRYVGFLYAMVPMEMALLSKDEGK